MRRLPEEIREAQPFCAFLADLAALGVVPVSEGGLRYAVIAARSNPRWWLLPLEDGRSAAAGLEMLQPVTMTARLAKIVARGLAHLGPHRILGRGQLCLSGLPDVGNVFSHEQLHIAYFTGTDGPHRKTVLQLMDESGAILGYAKLSRAPHVRPYLRNEAQMLARVRDFRLKSANVPDVLVCRDDEAMTLLVTDSLKSTAHSAPLAPKKQHFDFLAELRARTERPNAQEVLATLARKVATLTSTAGPEWIERLARVNADLRPVAERIPVCFAHGDFTPWNSFLQEGRLYVFDWEYANDAWPVGFDLAHFHLATKTPKAQLSSIPMLTNELAQAHFHGDEAQAADALILSLACHSVFYLSRLQEAQSPVSSWTDATTRAAMIDRMLESQRAK